MAQTPRPVYQPSGSFQQAFMQGTMRPPANAASFRSWEDALAGDANLRALPSDAQRTAYARGMYGLPHPYQIKNGQVVDGRGFVARNLGWIGPAALVASAAVPALMGGAPAAAAAGGGTTINAVGIPTTAAYAGAGAPTGGAGVAGGGFFSTLGRWLGSRGGEAVVNAGTQLVGGVLQNRANNRALDASERSNAETLAFLKDQDARDFAEYLKERDRSWRYEDEDRGRRIRFEDEREGRLAPYRAGGARAYGSLSSLMTLPPDGRMPLAVPVSPAARPVTLADLLRG